MEFNKSQLLIIGTISSVVLGFPNITKIFTEKVIEIVMEKPSQIIIVLVSIIKIILIISSILWLIQLIRNMKITYETKSSSVFQNYLLKLVVTGIFTFIGSLLLKNIIHL